jgi:hypothetical protein
VGFKYQSGAWRVENGKVSFSKYLPLVDARDIEKLVVFVKGDIYLISVRERL